MTFSTNNHKKEKLESLLSHMAAEFIAKELESDFLTTVIRAELNDSARHINIFISVLPETGEKSVIDSLSKHKRDFSLYVEKHARIGRMPSFDFLIDEGEKNRRRVEDII